MSVPSADNPLARNPVVLAIAAWLLPGAGFWLLGERGRAIVVAACIALCFWIGLALGGAANVIDRNDQYLWYLAQMITGLHLLIAQGLTIFAAHPPTGSKSVDLGLVFTGVAGLLNLVAVLETLGKAFPPESDTREAE